MGKSRILNKKEMHHMTIRIGILGYGNLGRGVECAVKHNPDMKMEAVFRKHLLCGIELM